MYGLDLFSGIGGLTKALDGYVQPVAYCENDRYAQSILLSRMATGDIPAAPIWDDVKTLNKTHFTPPSIFIDIIYGGFPCQDISVAGRGAGLEGERSGLFFEIVRLIGELRPRFVFLENVSAIRLRGGSVVVGELARLGYDCRWDVLSASDVGANHQRERWWMLAHANSSGCGKRRWPEHVQAKQHPAECTGEDVADTSTQGFSDRPDIALGKPEPITEFERQSWWAVEPDVGRVAHGIPFRVDRLRALGNAVVPAQAREAFERLMGLK